MTQPSPYFIRRNPEVMAEPFDSSMRRSFPDEDERKLDLLRYWITIKKHRWLIASVTAAVAIIVAIRVSSMVSMYTAEATILLQPGTPQLLDNRSPQSEEQTYEEMNDSADFVKTQCEILRSRTLAASVVQNEGLANDPAFTGRTVKPRESGSLTTAFKHWLKGVLGSQPAKPAKLAARRTRPQAWSACIRGPSR